MSATSRELLSIQNLHVDLGGQRILDDVLLSVGEGELVALIGDGSDAQWSTRFLKRVDALISG